MVGLPLFHSHAIREKASEPLKGYTFILIRHLFFDVHLLSAIFLIGI
jgi:hypothetical protein